MHREILNDLEKWKDKSRRKPLILTGVRQCGKTYIVNEFARKNFESYVYVNFESDETLAAIFDYDFDVDRIIKELEDALQWLVDAGLLIKAELVEKPELPLEAAADKTYFKVYMSDIGLLRAKSKVSVNTILEETDLYVRYKGAFAENYVLNELKSLGKEPFFWRSGNTAEVDFIYEEESEIVPVEVKAADNKQAKSYRQFCRKYQPKKGLKLSRKNIAENLCESTTTYSIPLYLEWNIDSYIKYN